MKLRLFPSWPSSAVECIFLVCCVFSLLHTAHCFDRFTISSWYSMHLVNIGATTLCTTLKPEKNTESCHDMSHNILEEWNVHGSITAILISSVRSYTTKLNTVSYFRCETALFSVLPYGTRFLWRRLGQRASLPHTPVPAAFACVTSSNGTRQGIFRGMHEAGSRIQRLFQAASVV